MSHFGEKQGVVPQKDIAPSPLFLTIKTPGADASLFFRFVTLLILKYIPGGRNSHTPITSLRKINLPPPDHCPFLPPTSFTMSMNKMEARKGMGIVLEVS